MSRPHHWLLHLYPPAWRERYGDEFLAVLEAQPDNPKVIIDVALGALDAWLRPQVPPRHSPAIAGGAQSRRRTDRFDKFTKRSRGALQFANEEAGRLGHDFIGTEHLLLGLLHESDGVAAGVLSNMGLDSPKVRAAILAAVSSTGDTGASGRSRGLTQRAKRAIELSVEEANRLRHHYVGTEHLLLGLVREGDGVAAQVLADLGTTDLTTVRRHILRVLTDRH